MFTRLIPLLLVFSTTCHVFADEDKNGSATRHRIVNKSEAPIGGAIVRQFHQTETFRELIQAKLIYETKTDPEGFFTLPAGNSIARAINENGGLTATWVTIPTRDGKPERTWLLGSSAGVREAVLEGIFASRDQDKFQKLVAEVKDKKFPTTYRLIDHSTSFHVMNHDGSPAANVEVTPTRVAWIMAGTAAKPILVPTELLESFRRKTDADGRVTFDTIKQAEFSEIEFRSPEHGLQRTFSNQNTIGHKLEKAMVLFPVGKVAGRIATTNETQAKFVSGKPLVFKSKGKIIKGFNLRMDGFATVTPDQQGRFEIPQMVAGKVALVDQRGGNANTRIVFPNLSFLRPQEIMALEGRVISATTVRGVVRKHGSNEPVASASISIRHGGNSGISRSLTARVRSDGQGRFEAKVFPGPIGYSSMTAVDGFVQKHFWTQEYMSGAPYGKRFTVPESNDTVELPPIEMLPTKPVRGKVVDAAGSPVTKAGVYARHKSGLANDYAKTDAKGEFTLKRVPVGYPINVVKVGAQYKPVDAKIVSRDPLVVEIPTK